MILNNDDYYEERRREDVRRIRARKFRHTVDMVLNVGMILGAVLFVILLFANIRGCQDVRQRAAYLEGYYGIDHATAMVYARLEQEACE